MKVLLIPSALIVAKDMQNVGKIPSVMYPINGYIVLDYIIEQYSKIVDKIYIIAYENKEIIHNYIDDNSKFDKIEIIDLDVVKDLGYSIFKGIEYCLKKNNNKQIQLYINFGDTIVENEIEYIKEDTIFYSEQNLNDKWTFFNTDINGKITEIIDKKESFYSKDINRFFVGAFYISDGKEFSKYLLDSVDNKSEFLIDSFYSALMKYSSKTKINYIFTEKWFDSGHPKEYMNTKASVKPREFNHIDIDSRRGILTKTSENKAKLIDEIKWYLKLPGCIQYMSPRIYEYSLDIDNPSVSMEYYSYHTLHELYLYGDLNREKWKEIFNRIKVIIDDMSKYTVKDEKKIRESLTNIYIDKTIERLQLLQRNKAFTCFFEEDIIVNEIKFPNLKVIMEKIKNNAEKIIYNVNEFSIIHGDLCFSNILIDDKLNFLRVIDPRGKFGSFDIYGDKRYEFAKLFHRLEGKYDYIIKDLFKIEINQNTISFKVMNTQKGNSIFECFLDIFKNDISNVRDIQFIESLLFLSMIPLHSESINRQYAMMAVGLLLLNKCSII